MFFDRGPRGEASPKKTSGRAVGPSCRLGRGSYWRIKQLWGLKMIPGKCAVSLGRCLRVGPRRQLAGKAATWSLLAELRMSGQKVSPSPPPAPATDSRDSGGTPSPYHPPPPRLITASDVCQEWIAPRGAPARFCVA